MMMKQMMLSCGTGADVGSGLSDRSQPHDYTGRVQSLSGQGRRQHHTPAQQSDLPPIHSTPPPSRRTGINGVNASSRLRDEPCEPTVRLPD